MGTDLPKPNMVQNVAGAARNMSAGATLESNPMAQKGMTLHQAIQFAKANPSSDFTKTLGGFIQRGEADDRAMHEGVDLSFAGRPGLKDMYANHITMKGGKPPGADSPIEHFMQGFMDLVNKAGDNTVQQQQEGSDKIVSSIREGAGKIEEATDKIAGAEAPTAEDLKQTAIGEGESGLGAASGAVQAVFAPITGIIQAISDKASDSKAVQAFANGAGPLVDLYDQLEKKIGEISAQHPEAAKNIGDAANVLLATLGGETGMAKADVGEAADAAMDAAKADVAGAGTAIKDTAGKMQEKVAAVPEKITSIPGNVKEQVPLTAKSIFSKIYRMSPDTSSTLIDYAHEHPETNLHDVLTQQNIYNLSKQVEHSIAEEKTKISSPENISKEVESGLQKKVHALNEHAKQYSTLGNDSAPGAPRKGIKVDPNWLKAKLESVAGVKVGEKGQITHGNANAKINPIDSPGGARVMQDLWDTYAPEFAKGEISRAIFLKFRQSLAAIADYGQQGERGTLENVGHGLRDAFNTDYRKQVPNLEKIDAEHTKMERDLEDSLTGIATVDKTRGSPKIKLNEGAVSNMMNADDATRIAMQKRLESIVPGITKKIEEANQFNKEWQSIVDENGNLRENALSNIKNSLNAGKDLRLGRLEKIMPGITAKLKLIHAADEYHNAMKGLPGAYVGASAMSQIFTGNPLLGLAGAFATQPNIGIKLLQTIGRMKSAK